MCLERTLGEGFITELMELPRHSSKGKKQKEIITATITPSKRLMMKNHIPFCFLRPSIQRYDFPVSIFVVDNWHKASTNFKKQIGFNSCLFQDAPSSNGIYLKGSAKHDCLYWPQNKSKYPWQANPNPDLIISTSHYLDRPSPVEANPVYSESWMLLVNGHSIPSKLWMSKLTWSIMEASAYPR